MEDGLDFVRKDIDHDLCNYRVDQKELIDKSIEYGKMSDTPEITALNYIVLSLLHENIKNVEFELVFTIPRRTNVTITLPIIEQDLKDPLGYYVCWGDKTKQTHNVASHTYLWSNEIKKYTVKFFGLGIKAFSFYGGPLDSYIEYLTDVISFGKLGHIFTSLSYAFRFCKNITIPDYLPSNITNLSGMFIASYYFNRSINNWDVSRVTNMEGLFNACMVFNQPLDKWNVSNVINMKNMFAICPTFNQPLNNWNVSNVTNMEKMFLGCTFNQPLDNWDVSNVINMKEMFHGPGFNQPINNWNVSNVINNTNMFEISDIEEANKPIFRIIN